MCGGVVSWIVERVGNYIIHPSNSSMRSRIVAWWRAATENGSKDEAMVMSEWLITMPSPLKSEGSGILDYI